MTEPLTVSNTILRHKIRCKFSNLEVGLLEVRTTVGALPYISYWNECIAFHPVFSLQPKRLLDFTENEWKRLAQRAADQEISQEESDILCVSFLAVLHLLDSVKQDFPCLPPLAVVHTNIAKLFNLAYWKWALESERFRFPTLHISKYNNNSDFSNLSDYLNTCFEIRRSYENDVREAVEVEKVKAAERAIANLNSQWVTPTSKKLLWQWVKAHLPEEYKGDAWLATLFLGGASAIIDFDEDELDLMEEIITSCTPVGSVIRHAVMERIAAIRNTWEQHHKAFSIDLEDYAENANLFVNGEKVAAPHPGPEPTIAGLAFNKAKFYVAHAKWSIAMAAFIKQGGIL